MSTTADIAARLLREVVGAPGPVEPCQRDWDDWFAVAMEQRVLPLLHSVAHENAELAPSQLEQVLRIQVDSMSVAVRIEHWLLEASALLSSADIEFCILKGVATAHLDYEAPTLRQFADADVLVSSDDFDRCCELLQEYGWSAPYALPQGHTEFIHAITLRHESRAEIDVHRRVAHRGLGELIPPAVLLERRVPCVIGERPLWALSRHDRLLHAAVHAVGSRGVYRRLSSVADVLVLADRCAEDAEQILAQADEWRIMPIVSRAVRDSFDAARLPLPAEWEFASGRRPANRDRLVEHAYLSGRRRPISEELAYLRLLRGWGSRYAYLRGYLITGSDYAQRKSRHGVVSQLKYLLERARSR